MQFGRYYEEFEVGAIYKHWPGRTITEYDNTLFALLSMNQNPLFIDEHYARTQPLGRRPVLDSLIFSLTVGMKRLRHQRQDHRQSRLRERAV